MAEVLKEHCNYNNITSPIKCIYGLVQAVCNWFKEYIKTMTLKSGLNQCKTDTCILYGVNELGTDIFSV